MRYFSRLHKSRAQANQAAAAVMMTLLVSACGSPAKLREGESALLWTPSRPGDQRFAYIETKDLQDQFVFGASVINVTGFLSSALNMTIPPMNVRLEKNDQNLLVRTLDGQDLMAFGLVEKFPQTSSLKPSQLEIDFATAGNDVKLRQLIDEVGGAATADSTARGGFWVSSGAPKVLNVQQDLNTLVVDLSHEVIQAVSIKGAGTSSHTRQVLNDRSGTVIVRLFLVRKSSLPQFSSQDARSVAEGRSAGIGYFGAQETGQEPSTDGSAIQRFALPHGRSQSSNFTFYLKGFPVEYQGAAREAILAWNDVLGTDARGAPLIQVRDAPDDIEAGDPRYNVVKWFDGTDLTARWAGVSKMLVEPDSGLVMGGSIYIQGSTVIDLYRGITAFTSQASLSPLNTPVMSLGSMSFSQDHEESPVVPYFTQSGVDFAAYMQGYYKGTIAHEVGHVLGLRHNFKGSTLIEQQGLGSSLMDYEPRSERSKFAGIGVYDRAAIRWGYFGETPKTPLPFCTDEDMPNQWDCNIGDHGDPVDYAVNGLIDGTNILTQKAIPIVSDVLISSMKDVVDIATKVKVKITQLPADRREQAMLSLDHALEYFYSATPAANLTPAEKQIVEANLAKMRAAPEAQ